jgi:hypothetical protein
MLCTTIYRRSLFLPPFFTGISSGSIIVNHCTAWLIPDGWVSKDIEPLLPLPLFTVLMEDRPETSLPILLGVVLPDSGSLGIGEKIFTNYIRGVIINRKLTGNKKSSFLGQPLED